MKINEHFLNGFAKECKILSMNILWVAAHILLFLICSLKDPWAIIPTVVFFGIWCWGYSKLLLMPE